MRTANYLTVCMLPYPVVGAGAEGGACVCQVPPWAATGLELSPLLKPSFIFKIVGLFLRHNITV